MHAHRYFLPGYPSGIHIRHYGYYTRNYDQKEQPAQVTSAVVLVLLPCCATLAHSIRTEISLCYNLPPISVFCFKKSICWPAITPLPAPASVALRHLYLFDLIDELGYRGWIGCEYHPRQGTVEGLGWARPYGLGPSTDAH